MPAPARIVRGSTNTMLHPVARHTVRYTYAVIGIVLILLAIFTLTARIGLPLVASYKNSIETRVSAYLNNPVDIGKLSLRWEGFGPLLRAVDVAVLETQERKVTLDELLIDINLAKTLLRGEPVINELSLVGVNLVVDADASGQLRVHGVEQTGQGNKPIFDNAGSDTRSPAGGIDLVSWLFNARKVGLLDSTLTLIDLNADRQLVIDDLNVRAENNGDFHQLRVEASLPGNSAAKLEAGIDLRDTGSQLSESDGSVYIKADQLQVSALSTILGLSGIGIGVPEIAAHIDAEVSVEVSGQWKQGKLVSLIGPVTATSIMNADTGQSMLDEIRANVSYSRGLNSDKLVIRDLGASDSQHQLDIRQSLIEWNADGTDAFSMAASGSSMPLAMASRVLQFFKLSSSTSLSDTLQDLTPEGELNDWSVAIKSTADDQSITASGDIENFAVAPAGWLPGLGPISGRLELENSKGQLTMEANQMLLDWPAMSDVSLQVDAIQGQLNLDLSNLQRLSASGAINLSDDGIRTQTRIAATLVPGESPHLDIQSGFDIADITAIKQWIPHKLLTAPTVEWIDNAIRGGEASNGSLLLFGSIADFPFYQGEGVFRASADLQNAELAYLPDWPLAEDIAGSIELNGFTLTGRAQSARTGRFDVTDASVRIGSLEVPVLEVNGTGNGTLADSLTFANEGPLGIFLEPVLYDVSGNGNVEMDVAVTFPLYSKPNALTAPVDETELSMIEAERVRRWKEFSVDGSLFLKKNDVSMERAGITLEDVTGAVGFDQHGIKINNVRSSLLGHAVLLNAETTGTESAAVTSMQLQGALEINDVLAQQENTLDQFVRGSSNWTINLVAPHSEELLLRNGVAMTVSSDLVGTELLVPAPLHKPTALAVPFRLTTSFREPEDLQRWEIEYGDELQVLATSIDNELVSLLGYIGNEAVQLDKLEPGPEGIRLQGNVEKLALDGWVQIVSRYIDSLSDELEEPEFEPILPISAALSVDSLLLGDQSLGKATFRSNTDDVFVNIAASNQYFTGNVRYPRRYWEKQVPMRARIQQMDWLIIDALSSDDPGFDSVDTGELDPRLLPPVEARISRLTRGDLALRDLVVRAEPDVSGINLTTIGFAYQTMRLVGQGHWHLTDPQSVSADRIDQHKTQLNLVLQSDDFGEGLSEIGLDNILLDGQGSVELKLAWPGPVYSPQLERLDGNIKLDLEGGSIIPVEPGVGRVVGLFALQSLPRRLNLDFKDLTEEGLAFKKISGSAKIDNGIATVDLVQLTGPIGVVDVTGKSDLIEQQFDQEITVLPRVSAALPIIGVISGGASAGIGALFATGFLKAMGIDFDRIGLRAYSLKGDWSDPELKPLSTSRLRDQ